MYGLQKWNIKILAGFNARIRYELLWTSFTMDFDCPDRKASVVVDRLRWKNELD